MDPFRSRRSSSVEAADPARADGFPNRTETVPLARNNNAMDETANLSFYPQGALKPDQQDPTMWIRKPPHHLPPIDQSLFKENTAKTSCSCKPRATKQKTLPDIERSALTRKECVCLKTSKPTQHESENNYFDENSVDEPQRDDSRFIGKHIQGRFVSDDDENRPNHTGRRRRFKQASSLSFGIEDALYKVPFPPNIAQSEGIQNDHHATHSKGSISRGDNTNTVQLEVLFHPAPRAYVVQNNGNICMLNDDKSCCNQENTMEKLATNADCQKRPCDTGRRRRFKPASSLNPRNWTGGAHPTVPFPPMSSQNDGMQNEHGRSQPNGRVTGVSACRGYGIDAAKSEVPFPPRPPQLGEVVNHDECRFGAMFKEKEPVSCIQESCQQMLLGTGDGDNLRPSDTRRRRKFRPASAISEVGNATEESRYAVTLPPIHAASDGIQKNQPRSHPGGQLRREGVCRDAEAADLVKERTKARVFLKKFGKLPKD